MIYRPMYVYKFMAYVDTPFVKVLTGVRRCGKSILLKMIMEKLQVERNFGIIFPLSLNIMNNDKF